ncbi:hypothetical protein M3484_23120 [Pseudomonas sp. GX19020]|uniref:hypothetical protein n=1 Tax=Pseudomonas sp. GX19020 TaxID=2942277 RepID=UPI002019B077|nr:hypothetical protein [Pseudomonas sp. GX19020]MCL4069453.1 hypothetical protein [Pseudomonas sp. GX19020]
MIKTRVLLKRDAPVLLLEDEYLVLLDLKVALEDMGFTDISCSASVSDALKRCAMRLPEFALLDVNLGSEKSFPVAHALYDKGVPFVFVTAYGRAGLEGQYDDIEVLTKPVDAFDIGSVIAMAQG